MIACAGSAVAIAAVAEAAPAGDALRWSESVLAALRTGVVTPVEARLDDGMRAALPAGGLVAVFESVHKRVGVLRECEMPTRRESADLTIVDYPCRFDRGSQTVRLTWTSNGRLAGLFVLPAPMAVALPADVREEAVVTGSAGWPLPGSLLVPTGDGTHPIVVLVHGSGRNDRDETVGPNKPFRDLAFGLARLGIASLRYDKRTLALGDRFEARFQGRDWTLDDEIIDDAVGALTMATYRAGAAPVFIVGHSEGALLAPRIAEAAKARGVAVAGVVMLAAPLTPLADLELEQYVYLGRLPGSSVTPAMLDEARARRENLRALVAATAGGLPRPAARPLPGGLPATVWLDFERYDPAASLLAQPQLPALLVFGGRDYQVPIRELGLWKARLGSRPRTQLLEFPAINHLLMDGIGAMTPAEYAVSGRVSPALIDVVGRWILDQAAPAR